jgi:glycosyltransferase involved in cell wall biosynthesis
MGIDMYLPSVDGVVNCMHHYIKCLNEEHNAAAMAPSAGKKYVDRQSYRIYRCKGVRVPFYGGHYGFPSGDRGFLRELEKTKWDIIHVHSPMGMCKFAAKYAKKHNIPVVATFHTNFRPIVKKIVGFKRLTEAVLKGMGKRLDKMDDVFVCSPGVAEQARSFGYTGHITYLPFGTNLPRPGNLTEMRDRVNHKYGFAANELVFIFVGRVVKLKRIDFILESLKLLKSKGVSFKFFVVGTGMDEKTTKRKANKLGLESDVIFTGFVEDFDDFKALYARADLLLFPSLYDNFGLVKVEAAAHNTPGVYIKGSNAAYCVEHGVNGFLSENDAESFAAAIGDAVSDRGKLLQAGKNASETLYITWADASAELAGRYAEIIAAKKAADTASEK